MLKGRKSIQQSVKTVIIFSFCDYFGFFCFSGLSVEKKGG